LLEAFQLIKQIELAYLVLGPGEGKIQFCGGGSLVNLQLPLLCASISSSLCPAPLEGCLTAAWPFSPELLTQPWLLW